MLYFGISYHAYRFVVSFRHTTEIIREYDE